MGAGAKPAAARRRALALGAVLGLAAGVPLGALLAGPGPSPTDSTSMTGGRRGLQQSLAAPQPEDVPEWQAGQQQPAGGGAANWLTSRLRWNTCGPDPRLVQAAQAWTQLWDGSIRSPAAVDFGIGRARIADEFQWTGYVPAASTLLGQGDVSLDGREALRALVMAVNVNGSASARPQWRRQSEFFGGRGNKVLERYEYVDDEGEVRESGFSESLFSPEGLMIAHKWYPALKHNGRIEKAAAFNRILLGNDSLDSGKLRRAMGLILAPNYGESMRPPRAGRTTLQRAGLTIKTVAHTTWRGDVDDAGLAQAIARFHRSQQVQYSAEVMESYGHTISTFNWTSDGSAFPRLGLRLDRWEGDLIAESQFFRSEAAAMAMKRSVRALESIFREGDPSKIPELETFMAPDAKIHVFWDEDNPVETLPELERDAEEWLGRPETQERVRFLREHREYRKSRMAADGNGMVCEHSYVEVPGQPVNASQANVYYFDDQGLISEAYYYMLDEAADDE